jgi:hypothetical protein
MKYAVNMAPADMIEWNGVKCPIVYLKCHMRYIFRNLYFI